MELDRPVLDESVPSALLETRIRDDEESCSLGLSLSMKHRRREEIKRLQNLRICVLAI